MLHLLLSCYEWCWLLQVLLVNKVGLDLEGVFLRAGPCHQIRAPDGNWVLNLLLLCLGQTLRQVLLLRSWALKWLCKKELLGLLIEAFLVLVRVLEFFHGRKVSKNWIAKLLILVGVL